MSKSAGILLLLLFTTCCSHIESTGPSDEAFEHFIPKPGSLFRFAITDYRRRDTSVNYEIKEIGLYHYGKRNVSRLVNLDDSSRDTVYIAYEPNGNFSILRWGRNASVWYEQPTMSREQFTLPTEIRITQSSEYRRDVLITPLHISKRVVNGHPVQEYNVRQTVRSCEKHLSDTSFYCSEDIRKSGWSHTIGMFTYDSVDNQGKELINYELVK
jgi:hypothetical protein